MDRLATEFAIYKTFISAHPLDGMYSYARSKHNFISMFADKEDYGEFTILWYIKTVNRWMRGGFFLKVEDISGEIEFYLNEKLDLKPFDLVIIKWYQSRRANIDQIQLFTHEELIEKVKKAGRYKPEETVAKARNERMQEVWTLTFPVPDTIEAITQLKAIINDYPGRQKVVIWWTTITLNDQWVEKITALFNH